MRYLILAALVALFAACGSPSTFTSPIPTPLPQTQPSLSQAQALEGVEAVSETFSLPSTPVTNSRPSVLDLIDHTPPIASLITVGNPAPNGETQVEGAPGAVPSSVAVMVASIEYGHTHFVQSDADGGFSASVLSGPGGTIQVRYNPYGPDRAERRIHQKTSWPGTLIRVSDGEIIGEGKPFSGVGVSVGANYELSILWSVTGVVPDSKIEVNDAVPVSGTVRIYIPDDIEAPPSLTAVIHFGIDIAFDAEGRQASAGSSFLSRLLTPSGLPIERNISPGDGIVDSISIFTERQEGAMVGSFSTQVAVPNNLPAGTYRLFMGVSEGPHVEVLGKVREPNDRSEKQFKLPGQILRIRSATITFVTIGSAKAPQLSAMLLANSVSQGGRGVIALEEQGRYQLSNRIAIQPKNFVVPPRDPANGELIPYRLEPFFPYLSMADREFPITPLLPLDLPGGSLTLTVQAPSGLVKELGPLALSQTRTGQPATSSGLVLTNGGGNPGNLLQLTTLSEDFVYHFTEYGLHKISLSGSISDIWGQEYPFDSEFEVWAAETLDLETAALPSTPFQETDHLPAVVNIYPGVPADIEMSFDLYPIDGTPMISESVEGRANRFGYFDGGGKYFAIDKSGEYLVRVSASFTDDEGRLWMGVRRWGSGVASSSPGLIAHGRRGDDSQEVPERRAWFTRSAIGIPADTESHLFFPYHSGDVLWAVDNDATVTSITIQDGDGQIAKLLNDRAHLSFYGEPDFEGRLAMQELPLITSAMEGIEPTFAIEEIDQWGYAYRSVQRPGIRVREFILTDMASGPYWRFQDMYLAQRGMGLEGDLPHDLKWMFGAAIFKRPALSIGEVAIYGSLWVEIPDDDSLGSRVFPPFQGAAGGPTGGPIMSMNGKEIDLFIMPTAVRPGAVLEVGDRFVFAGQIGPPLGSKVKVQVTSPTGKEFSISGQANPIGYFASPGEDISVDEPGIWFVNVEVLHDGLTSAGPLEPPHPTGDVLGSVDGTYKFYVVPKDVSPLDFNLVDLSFAEIPFDDPGWAISFYPRIPEGWTEVEGEYVISMPGFILDEDELDRDDQVLKFAYRPKLLNREFPNIDLEARDDVWAHGVGGLSDEVFISVFLSGIDDSGQPAYGAKLLILVGDDIYDLN